MLHKPLLHHLAFLVVHSPSMSRVHVDMADKQHETLPEDARILATVATPARLLARALTVMHKFLAAFAERCLVEQAWLCILG